MAFALFRTQSDQRINVPIRTNTQRFCLVLTVRYQAKGFPSPRNPIRAYIKGLAHHNPVEALALHSRLERIKWRLWHGDTDVALSRARELAADVAALTSDYPGQQRFAKAAAGLVTDIDNNAAAIPDYGERRRYAEPISTAFTESTVNLVVGKRFAKKQQMQWSKAGAHLLLQTRTQTLDGTGLGRFRRPLAITAV